MSCSNFGFSISVSIYSSARSISWAKSWSPCLLCASCLDESSTYTGIVSSSCVCCAPCCICPCCTSFSCLHSSCSFWSWSFNSCNFTTISSILYFSLYLCVVLLSWCYLFTSISKAAFYTSGSALNLQLCSTSTFLKIFLCPLSRVVMFTSNVGALLDAASLTIPQRCWPVHWAWRSCDNIFMGLPHPNDMPRGSMETVLLCSDPSQNNVGHMD